MKNNKLKNNLLFKNIKDMNAKVLVILSIGVFATVFFTSYALFTTQLVSDKSLQLSYSNYSFAQEFSYTGDYQEFIVPKTGYYYIEANGASGGGSLVSGGLGGQTSGFVYLKEGEKLYIYIGAQGIIAPTKVNDITDVMYNGGGYAGGQSGFTDRYFGTGGGATDIRYFGNVTPSSDELKWNSELGLNSRIMVASGGGGSFNELNGGDGGGLLGNSGHGPGDSSYGTAGTGGSQTSAGYATCSGTCQTNLSGLSEYTYAGFGYGGNAVLAHAGTGGGSGYYGGGASVHVQAGGGGSSFISGYAGSNAITSANDRTHTNNTLHYSDKYFLNGKMIEGINEGNGNATITYAGNSLTRTNDKLDNVRYIKDCINGSSKDLTNAWEELQAIVDGKNIAYGKTVTSTGTIHVEEGVGNWSLGAATDGSIVHIDSDLYIDETGLQCITVDLGKTYDLDEVAVWHFTNVGGVRGSRSYNNHSLSVSSDNSTWTTLIDNETGVVESAEGKRISAYDGSIEIFNYTGHYQEYTAPKSGYYFIEANGASGGDTKSYNNGTVVLGGNGGYTSGYVYLKSGERLYIYVGGTTTSATGGYNGGGSAGGAYNTRGGGGATDIRYFGNTTPSYNDLYWNSELGLNSRIMVAAGGAGAEGYYFSGSQGSYGGGLLGENGHEENNGYDYYNNSTGGTQTSGGAGAIGSYTGVSGNFGYGGSATTTGSHASGGGSGYYGGGSGSVNNNVVGTGAGGSSFISGYAGVNAITSSNDRTHTNNTLHYSDKYFIDGYMLENANDGNGSAKIAYAGRNIERINTKLDNVRYVKDCINGSSSNVYNHWTEIQAIVNGENIAFEKDVDTTATLAEGNYKEVVTDGKIEDQTEGYINGGSGEQCVTIDLESTYDLDEIAVWHYYADGRSYNNHSLYVSSDNSNWTTLIDNESGVVETSEGKRITAYNNSYTLTNLIPNSSMENTGWSCSYSSEVSRYGDYSCKLTGTTSTIEQYATLSSSITLNNTHKYYGRVEIFATAVNGESVDIFWPISGEGYFGSVGILQPNQWDVYGIIVDRTNIANGSHGLRLDYNNNYLTNTAYYDGAMLIDLTEAFGAGNEPSVEWCNKNIPYFNGKTRINVNK